MAQKIEKLDRNKILNIINRLDFFDKFTIVEKHSILAFHTQFYVYDQDEFIIREGDHDSAFYLLLKGRVKVTKGDLPVALAFIEEGEFFGEISFLTNSFRTANIVADEMVIVIKIDYRMLKRLNIEIREKIKDKIIEKLVNRLEKMNVEYVNQVD